MKWKLQTPLYLSISLDSFEYSSQVDEQSRFLTKNCKKRIIVKISIQTIANIKKKKRILS